MSRSSRTRHPLGREDDWYFTQHNVGFCAPLYLTPRKDSTRRPFKKKISATDICRETLISKLRREISHGLGSFRSVGSQSWRRSFTYTFDPDLDQKCLKQPGESWISVSRHHITLNRLVPNPHLGTKRSLGCGYDYTDRKSKMVRSHTANSPPLRDEDVNAYLRLCDAIVGPITVLLNPDRYQGNWWRTEVGDSISGEGLRWYGIDNTALWHPALVSLYSGLVRQCAYIARTDLVDQVLSEAEGMNLEECLTESDDKLARALVKRMQKWVAVPTPKMGQVSNVPVPPGAMNKIWNLHKAIYAYGFERTIGKDFVSGWNAHNSDPYNRGAGSRGINSLMGVNGVGRRGKAIENLAKKSSSV